MDFVRLTYGFAKDRGVLVLDNEEPVTVGIRASAALEDILEARRAIGVPIRLSELDDAHFDRLLSERYVGAGLAGHGQDEGANAAGLKAVSDELPQTADLLDSDDDAPVIRLINAMIAEAIQSKASDIHVEPYEDRLSVRFRIDGVLREVLAQAPALAAPLVSRIKVMARLDIAEKRVPQDGRMSLSLAGKGVDVRVSTLPARFGERVVMRILDKDQALLSLDDLGMGTGALKALKSAIQQPNGIVLVTGPTGSGKTTTLYAALALLNDQSRNILTVEDPIEYGLEGVGQTQVNTRVGMTFATGLRAILRQDPDIVMVGEIRDAETARIAVQASMTGHLVLSTVHTNSAAAAITRLRDLGIEPFLLSSSLTAVMAQRLVRRLCDVCKTPRAPRDGELLALGCNRDAIATVHDPKGCPACGGLGYSGRLGLYEIITMTDALRDQVQAGAHERDLAREGLREGNSLLEAGLRHVAAGRTSVAEIVRVTRTEGVSDGEL